MVQKKISNFDIRQIHTSGQCFRMEEIGEGQYRVLAGSRYLKMRQRGEDCEFFCSQEEFADFWSNYFDLEGDYAGCIASIDPEDTYLTGAARMGSGIRILRQDLWEMIVTFLISQQNHIARIRRCVENICRRYGREMEAEGLRYYAFPTPEALAGATEQELRDCNLGYRSKYVLQTARSVAAKEVDLELVARMDYPAARRELLRLYGVGEKVADCICLFGMHCLEAFPVDTHIRQALGEALSCRISHGTVYGMPGCDPTVHILQGADGTVKREEGVRLSVPVEMFTEI